MLKRKPKDCQPNQDPIAVPDYVAEDVYALRAVADGRGTEEQQQRAMRFIVENVCGTYDFAFRPQGDRETNLALGKQRAGQIIVWLLKHAPTQPSLLGK